MSNVIKKISRGLVLNLLFLLVYWKIFAILFMEHLYAKVAIAYFCLPRHVKSFYMEHLVSKV